MGNEQPNSIKYISYANKNQWCTPNLFRRYLRGDAMHFMNWCHAKLRHNFTPNKSSWTFTFVLSCTPLLIYIYPALDKVFVVVDWGEQENIKSVGICTTLNNIWNDIRKELYVSLEELYAIAVSYYIPIAIFWFHVSNWGWGI